MGVFRIHKGRDIRLKGAASKHIVPDPLPSIVAIQPPDFQGLKTRLLVAEGDPVKVGTPVLEDKRHTEIKIVSPASGRVISVNRGEKRALLEVVIETDGRQEKAIIKKMTADQIKGLTCQEIIQQLLAGGVWPCIRQRPFSKISNPQDTPKSIFIQAMNTEPLALDVDFILKDRGEEFQVGLDIIKKLTNGEVHVCCRVDASSKALTEAKNVQLHQFIGPHPAGNVSTHIHDIDPINKGETVWYIRAEDVLRVAALFLEGGFSAERFVAITGEGAAKRLYKRTIIGAPIDHVLEGTSNFGMRCISGSVLTGKNVGPKGFLCFYDSQITVIPEGGKREFLGWLSPGLNRFTFSKTFLSAFRPEQEVSLDTDEHGSHRAIVLNNIYDDYVPLDIPVFFLLRAIIGGDIEEAERLGILECDEEDFALCTFACPSKTDVGGIIRAGLNLIERQG